MSKINTIFEGQENLIKSGVTYGSWAEDEEKMVKNLSLKTGHLFIDVDTGDAKVLKIHDDGTREWKPF